jgi:hypothetical protein
LLQLSMVLPVLICRLVKLTSNGARRQEAVETSHLSTKEFDESFLEETVRPFRHE